MDLRSRFWCLVCLLVAVEVGCVVPGHEGLELERDAGVDVQPEQLCRNLCGACHCRGQLVGENVCQCSCDFDTNAPQGLSCTSNVTQLCNQMDVQCEFNGVDAGSIREPRGCHKMSCYETHHGHGGDYEGYEGHDGEGYSGYGPKEFTCCKEKMKHKGKFKHKKHKKEKPVKFHVIIKGKLPPQSCHHCGDSSDGYEEHDDGYRAAPQQPIPFGAGPTDMSIWSSRKNSKKQPFRRPVQPQHMAPPYPGPKSAEPPLPPPEHSPELPPMEPPAPEMDPLPAPPVTPFPEHPPTPPTDHFEDVPVAPKDLPPPPPPPEGPPEFPSFPPPPSSSPPKPTSMIPMGPPPRRIESSRHYVEPSYSSCPYDNYDVSYGFYHYPSAHPPPPPPPPPSYYRPYGPPSYDLPPPPPPPSSYQRSYSDHYDEPEPHYGGSARPPKYGGHSDHAAYDGYEDSYAPKSHPHEVNPFADSEVEDRPPPVCDPADILTYNQLVSRQIWESERARLYSTDPFQPTPRPLRDEFEPPHPETGPAQGGGSDSGEAGGEKNYEIDPVPKPPQDAFVNPVPAPPSPVAFPSVENEPVTYAPGSAEEFYAQPTPPPHYLWSRPSHGPAQSWGADRDRHTYQPGYSYSSPVPGYGRSATGRDASRRTEFNYGRPFCSKRLAAAH